MIDFQIVVSSFTCFSFLISIWLVLMERFNWLSSSSKQSHGKFLLIFWSLYFINENISMFLLKNGPVSMIRYVCSLLVLILGFKAPGLLSNPEENYVPLKDDKKKVLMKLLKMRNNLFKIFFLNSESEYSDKILFKFIDINDRFVFIFF